MMGSVWITLLTLSVVGLFHPLALAWILVIQVLYQGMWCVGGEGVRVWGGGGVVAAILFIQAPCLVVSPPCRIVVYAMYRVYKNESTTVPWILTLYFLGMVIAWCFLIPWDSLLDCGGGGVGSAGSRGLRGVRPDQPDQP